MFSRNENLFAFPHDFIAVLLRRLELRTTGWLLPHGCLYYYYFVATASAGSQL